jgi:hypothetical protein
MLRRLRAVWTVAAMFFCVVTYAQTPLTSGDVKNIIAAMKELKVEFDKNNAYGFDQMTQMEALVKGQAAYSKYLSIINKHGFADPEKWAMAVTRVFHAYAAYKMQLEQPNMQAEIQRSMAEIQNNPNLTPQQKQQMMQMMQQSTQSWSAYMNAPAADIQAVKPFAGEIERTFK